MPVGNPVTELSSAGNYVPIVRTLSINGTTYDLSANRSWTLSTLSSLIANAPLSFNSGTNTISISQSGNTTDGFLSSADWLTFSSKQPAITLTTSGNSGSSTLIGATLNVPTYTLVGLGGMSNPFTAAIGQIIYSNSAGAPLSLAPNTSTTKKYLSMTGDGTNGDAPFWDTIAASVGGSGTTNYIAKFTSSSAIGNSLIYEVGNNIGIGTILPSSIFTISKVSSNFIFDLENQSEPEFKIRAYNHGTATAPGLAFTYGLYYNATENAAIKFYRGGGSTGGFLAFTTNNGLEKVRIGMDGDVAIGITTFGGKLTVNAPTGGTSLYVTDSVNSTFYITHPSASRTSFYNGSTTRWLTEFGGDIGLEGSVVIGGSTPLARFHVKGGTLATSGTGLMVAAELTNGRLETYEASSCQALHTYFDSQTYEISAGSTSGWVSGLVITGRNASLLPDRVAIYTRSVQRLQVGGLGQLQLNAYTSVSSFTGTPTAYLACDSSGNIITSNPSTGRNTRLAFSAEVPNTWANMPTTLQFFDSSSAYVTQIDLSYYNQVRLIVNKQGTAGATGSKLLIRYQATTGAPFTESSYLDIGTSEVSVLVDTTSTILTTSWINLASGAIGDVWVALMGIDGDTVADPVFGNIYAEFRYN